MDKYRKIDIINVELRQIVNEMKLSGRLFWKSKLWQFKNQPTVIVPSFIIAGRKFQVANFSNMEVINFQLLNRTTDGGCRKAFFFIIQTTFLLIQSRMSLHFYE